MWSIQLNISYLQLSMSTVFYLLLTCTSLIIFANTALNAYTFVIVLLLIIQWWRSICYFRTIKGELALFDYIQQIYWHNQRWHIMRKPLLFRYVIILNLKSRHDGKRRTLFLMVDNLMPNDWRTLHYHLNIIDLS